MVSISVVTPTHERPENLRLLLESLRKQTLDAARFEVVIVDDGSGPSTTHVLQEARRSLLRLRTERFDQGGGPARARNRGIELATGDVIVFLDDDIAASPGLLRKHADFHDATSDPWRGLLGRVDWDPRLRITSFMRWLDRSGLQFAFDTWLEPGEVPEPHRAFYMANISLRRETLLAVGGFDERFPYPAFEDYELGWRLVERGMRITYDPDASAFHTRAIDLRTFRRRMEMVAESAVMLRAMHPDFPLYEVLSEERLPRAKFVQHAVYAPVAWLRRDDRRLGRLYRELVAMAYARGQKRALSR